MEIGNQIKSLRLRRGITQEALAQHLGVSPQAVSKWERDVTAPDINMLPDISAFFGVSIDALFALSDDTRMERIQNMLWDVRFLDPADVDTSRDFLLEKAKREPGNGRPHELLSDMENHLAKAHQNMAAEYAKESLRREPNRAGAFSELVDAMRGKCWDWCYSNHTALIRHLQAFLETHPDNWHAYMWLIDQLMDDYRFAEAETYMTRFSQIHNTWRVPLYRGVLAWHKGDRKAAFAIWEKAAAEYPQQWNIPDTIADYLARDGAYDEAVAYHRKAMELSAAPRYVDPLESIAQIYEIQGNPAAAIAALEEELALLATDWHCTEGETVDVVRREIARLRETL